MNSAFLRNFFAMACLAVGCLFTSTAAHAQQSTAASAVYGRGVHAYFSGNSAIAEQHFTEVIQAGSTDPRPYYFRGMVRLGQGRQFEAENDMRVGAAYEARNPGMHGTLGRALQRVQGPGRRTLEKFRRQARLERVQQGRQQTQRRYEQLDQRGPAVLRRPTALPLAQPIQPPQVQPPQAPAMGSGAKMGAAGSTTQPPQLQTQTPAVNTAPPAMTQPQPAAGSAAKEATDDIFGTAPATPADDPFGAVEESVAPEPTPAPAAASDDPFGEMPSPAADSADPFGEAAPTPAPAEETPAEEATEDDPFGEATPAESTPAPSDEADPFGEAPAEDTPAEEADDPFGESPDAPAEESDPFGEGDAMDSAEESDDPFGESTDETPADEADDSDPFGEGSMGDDSTDEGSDSPGNDSAPEEEAPEPADEDDPFGPFGATSTPAAGQAFAEPSMTGNTNAGNSNNAAAAPAGQLFFALGQWIGSRGQSTTSSANPNAVMPANYELGPADMAESAPAADEAIAEDDPFADPFAETASEKTDSPDSSMDDFSEEDDPFGEF